MDDKQVKITDRWEHDTGIAFYDDDGNEEIVADKKPEKEKKSIDEIDEV